MTVQKPLPWEFGGEGFVDVELGHRFACGDEAGHEEHVDYDDQAKVLPWSNRYGDRGDPARIKRINNHPVRVVRRAVHYGPWEDV